MVKEESTEQPTNGVEKKENEQYRKLFIGGLSMNTTDETLRQFYEQYGTVNDCVVMKDPHTRRSRGFGFVTYTTIEDVDNAMKARPHVIDGKSVDPKRAVPREASQKNEANISTKRLYVSGIREDHTEKHFEDYFGKYGTINKIEIIKDKNTGKVRGFAFVTFDDYDPVDKACLERQHQVGNHRCDVKKALSKEEIAKAQQMDRDRAERSQRSRGNVRGTWSSHGAGGHERVSAWSSQPAYTAQPWGGASGGYGSYAPSANADYYSGWGGQDASSWGPQSGGAGAAGGSWQTGGSGPWQHGGGGGGYAQGPPVAQGWGAPPPSQGSWGGPNQRNY